MTYLRSFAIIALLVATSVTPQEVGRRLRGRSLENIKINEKDIYLTIAARQGSSSGKSSPGDSKMSKASTGKSGSGTGKSSKSGSGTGKSSKGGSGTGKSSKGGSGSGKGSKGGSGSGKGSKGSKGSKGGSGSGKGSKGSKGGSGSGKGSKGGPTPTAMPTPSPTAGPTPAPTPETTGPPVPSPSAAPTLPCNLDPVDRRQMILEVLTVDNDVTPADEIEDNGSSANLAFEWLVDEDTLYLCPDDPKLIQRYVIAKLYYQTGGDNWDECRAHENGPVPSCNTDAIYAGENWLESSNECDWAFITCDDDACITRIEVDENNVSGTLIDEIDWLEFLQVYTMDGGNNELTGTIPTQFGNLPELIILDLDSNQLTGTIPEAIFETATGLQQLDLDSNNLTGTISTLLGTLTSLSFLQLHVNELTGTFPNEELLNLPLLTVISLSDLELTGTVSSELCERRTTVGGIITNLWADCATSAAVPVAQVPCPAGCCNTCEF